MKKMNKILLIAIIVVLAVVLIGGGVFAYLYFATDTFKSNKELFLTYISENNEILDLFKQDERMKLYAEKQLNNPYSLEGTIKLKDNTSFFSSQNNMNITFTGNTDEANNYSYRDIKLNYSNSEFLDLEYMNIDDYYGIKVKDILDKYIVFENNNLKQFFKKLGADDTMIELLPDKLDINDYEFSEYLSEEKLVAIKNQYQKILIESLTDEMFSVSNKTETLKDKTDVNYKVYTLTIKEKDGIRILKSLLSEIKDDPIIIDIAMKIMINEFKMTEAEADNYINLFKKYVQQIIDTDFSDDYTQSSYYSYDDLKEDNLIINVYVYNKKMYITEVVAEDLKFKLYSLNYYKDYASDNGLDNTFSIDFGTDDEMYTITFSKPSTEDSVIYKIALTQDNDTIINLDLKFSGLQNLEKVEESYDFTINISNLKLEYNYSGQKTFKDITRKNITKNDMAILNDAPNIEAILKLFEVLQNNFENTYNTKIQNMNMNSEDMITIVPGIIPYYFVKVMQTTDQNIATSYAIPVLGATMSSYIYIGNKALVDATSSIKNNDLGQAEIDANNLYFEKYIGEKVNGSNVNALISNVNSYVVATNRLIFITYTNVQGETMEYNTYPIELRVSYDRPYSISLDYDEQGYVNKINIVEK